MKNYLFTSERLGYRNWTDQDLPAMAKINADARVMEFFLRTSTTAETAGFIERMKIQFSKNGFCYFAVDKLEDHSFIGFIGISEQNYASEFTPCVDIGWRLAYKEWGHGYATEGAKKCLDFAFNQIGLKTINAICPVVNTPSERVMKKLGMKKVKTFTHPLLSENKTLETCVLYEIQQD